ncbi:hypothetical protein F5B20DRAFT_587827 [Whalleya microplaca]|nr:hypothetical protein F5B20DRAFT_587827 [Whalleya microplaca]
MTDVEVLRPLASAGYAALKGADCAPQLITTSNHSQHDKVEEVVTEEESCVLPAPHFHQVREYDRLFRLNFFGNGFSVGLSGRRGCIRTKVENRKDIEVRFNFFTLIGGAAQRQVANQFQTGQHEASNTLKIMVWRTAKKYTSTRARIDIEARVSSPIGSDLLYCMNWALVKDGRTNRRSTRKSVQTKAYVGSGVMNIGGIDREREISWVPEEENDGDEAMGAPVEETDSDPPLSSLSLLMEGLKELLRLIREPVTAQAPGTPAIEPNLQSSGTGNSARGVSTWQNPREMSSITVNGEPNVMNEGDLEAQPMQSTQQEATSKKKTKERKKPKGPQHFVVIGIFSLLTGIPLEHLVVISKPNHLFRDLWWGIMRLRGIEALVSLKDAKGFAVYKCEPFTPSHKRLKLDQSGKEYMAQLFQAYHSWSPERKVVEPWMNWIDTALNHGSKDPKSGEMLSIELILGWSVLRISVAVLTPVLLSLAIGLWLNSSDWTDTETIQTAWGVASYIATAGAFLGALLAIISSVSDK